jgi:hypothetical protein
MRSLLVLLVLAFALSAVAASDLSGKWTGTMDKKGPNGSLDSTPVFAELRVSGSSVTGTAGVPGFDPLALEKGMVNGDQLTFEVHGDDGLYSVKATIVSDTQMRGEVIFTAPGGETETADIILTRD